MTASWRATRLETDRFPVLSEADLGIAIPESNEPGNENVAQDREWKKYFQHSARRLARRLDRGLCIDHFLHDPASIGREQFARVGQGDFAGRPLHEPGPEPRFERGKVPADHRLRQAELPRR
jgi:hypothetical protein